MDGESLGRIGLTLGLLLGIPGLLLVLLRRFGVRLPGQPDGGGRLGVVSRVAIDAKHSLLLVRRDGREQLILLSPTGPVVLEAEVILNEAERAEQERAREQRTAQIEASRAAVQQASEKLQQRAIALSGWVRKAADRGGRRFHKLVEQKASPAKVPARKTARQRRRAKAA